jgi:hypothetical protein
MFHLSRQELLRKVGHLDHVARIREYEMKDGKSKGTAVYEVVNGSGLEFTVLRDKCLDIFELKYKGVPLHFTSKAGLTSPEYYAPERFTKHFQGGMLYTCGLWNVGTACEDEGRPCGMHGEISHVPAANVGVAADWRGDQYTLELKGEMREAALFGENLVLKRKISTVGGAKSFVLSDTLENQGFEAVPFMLLYHFNFGFPFLDETLRLRLPAVRSRQRENDYVFDDCTTFQAPVDGKREEVFYHEMAANEDGRTCILLFNDTLELGVALQYDMRNLPNLVQWKSMKSGDYALGIEPANCLPEGRARERERGTIRTIGPLEELKFAFEVTILEGRHEFEQMEENLRDLFARASGPV